MDDRHACRSAVLRDQPQQHLGDAPDDPAHARHPQGLNRKVLTMASPTVAANAYANLARILDTGGAGKGPDAGGGPSVGALVKDAIGSVLDAGKKSDAQTVAMAQGKANVMDVVTAVAETDVAV